MIRIFTFWHSKLGGAYLATITTGIIAYMPTTARTVDALPKQAMALSLAMPGNAAILI